MNSGEPAGVSQALQALDLSAFDSLVLRTPRLLLRPLGESDAEDLFDIFADEKVMRYWSSAPWSAIDMAQDSIARDLAALPKGEHLRLGISAMAGGRLIGTCTLFGFVQHSRRAELGYALASTAWGQGFMNEALTGFLQHGFTRLRLNRVEADIDPRNGASARTLERLGFTREGFMRERWIVGAEVSDTAFYGLLAREWRGAGV